MKKSRITAAFLLGALLMLGPVSAHAGNRHQRDDVTIARDGQFDHAHGVRSGRGTPSNPYVVSGWQIQNLTIHDTTKAVRIVDNTIGSLTLNWIGSKVLVRGNDVGDLRVNENVPRWGAPTSGVIERNGFGLVSQIRHFDGMFVHNIVGAPNSDLFGSWFNGRAVNFDGFNGAHFAYNTIYGYVDARLHGHHHSSTFGAPSHMHTGTMDAMADHSKRFHEVWIDHNHIISNGSYALAYLDTDHEGNDRTAASETNPNLAAPHVHYTRVHITNNQLDGSGILIDVFNAKDDLHKAIRKGLVEITGNRIALHRATTDPFQTTTGITVWSARGLTLRIDRNSVAAPTSQWKEEPLHSWETQGVGISLGDIDGATVSLSGDRVTNLQYGIQASQMTRTVRWTIERLSTSGVSIPVSYDSSVANRPTRR